METLYKRNTETVTRISKLTFFSHTEDEGNVTVATHDMNVTCGSWHYNADTMGLYQRFIGSDSNIMLVAPAARALSLHILVSGGLSREILVIDIPFSHGHTGSMLKWLHVGSSYKVTAHDWNARGIGFVTVKLNGKQ